MENWWSPLSSDYEEIQLLYLNDDKEARYVSSVFYKLVLGEHRRLKKKITVMNMN
jgi:hypothetical protein